MSEQRKIVVELAPHVLERLNDLAAASGRPVAVLAAEAISDFVDVQSWQVEQIKDAVRQADAGGPFVSHERVAAWVRSLGTDNPLPKPGA